MHRRRFLQSSAIAGTGSPMVFTAAMAQQQATPAATPESDGDGYLADRVARIDPGALLDAMLTTPVASPLFPAGTPPIETVAWDWDDTAADGAIGGVIFNTGYDAGGSFDPVGLSAVHPSADAASAAAERAGQASPGTFLGLPWGVTPTAYAAMSGVQIDYLQLTGVAEPATGGTADHGILALRAISHMTALIAHLESVLSDLGAD